MDLLKMIAELQVEKQRLDDAIEALERLSSANQRRKGKPARWGNDEQTPASSPPGVDRSGIDLEDRGEDIEANTPDG
jgi:hypothetical protein